MSSVPDAASRGRTGISVEGPLREALPLLPLVGIFVVWAALDGGYDPVRWLPGAVFSVGLVAAFVLAAPASFTRDRTAFVAAVLLLAFTVWCYVSIAWAGVAGDALDGANRTLLYLCVFVAFAWQRLRPATGFALLGVYAAATAAIGLVDFLRIGDVEASFVAGRLATPITYPNANAALFFAASLPAIVLASTRALHPLVRAAMLGAAGVAVELGLLCQSRASVVALPAAAVLVLAVVPRRLSILLVLAVLAIPVGLATHDLLAVYPAVTSHESVGAHLSAARHAVVWSLVALVAAGLVLALVDRRATVPPRVLRAMRIAVAAALAMAVVVAIVAFVVRYGDPVGATSRAWSDFKSNASENVVGTSHLLSGVGSSRYDLWRVALDEFRQSPLYGVGVDNYAAGYLRLRRTYDAPLYPHSLELRLLAQTGLVGTILFAGFLAACAAGTARALRRAGGEQRMLSAALLGGFFYWFLHGSVDWLWEYPALTAPAVAWLAAAARRDPGPAGPPRRRELRFLWLAPAAAALVVLAFPWLAAREVRAATDTWQGHTQRAFDRLDLAERLNPLSDKASVVEGMIAVRTHSDERARQAFAQALDRNPSGWFPRLELAVLDSQSSRYAQARRQLEAALRLNPREPVLHLARATVDDKEPMEQSEVDRTLLGAIQLLTGGTQR